MNRKPIVRSGKPYPFLRTNIVVANPLTGRQVTLNENCMVDTGFGNDVFVAGYHISEINQLGVRLYDTKITLADGREVMGKLCYARVEKIADFEFPPLGIEISLVCYGEPKNSLLGLRLLSKWIAELHGPKQLLTLFEPNT